MIARSTLTKMSSVANGIQQADRKPRDMRTIKAAIESLEDRLLFTAITSTTTGGNWHDTTTWVGGVVPTNSVDVNIVAGATVTVSDGEGVATLTTQPGSTLVLTKPDANHVGFLEILGATNTIAGTLISGAGTDISTEFALTISGTSTINGGISQGLVDNTGTMNLGGSGADLNGVILTNDATMNLTGGVSIGNADLVNGADGTLNITDNIGVTYDSFDPAGNNHLINKGTLNKTGGAGTYTLIDAYQFENIGGTFNLESGNFSVVGNTRFNGGTFNIAAGSTFSIDSDASGQNYLDGTTIGTGGGTFAMNAGLFVPGSPDLTDADGTLDFPAGMAVITGASFSNRDVNHIFNTGFLTLKDPASGPAVHGGISIDNQGNFTDASASPFVPNLFINDTTGIVDLTNDQPITAGNLYNLGTVEKTSGTGITVVSAQYFAQGGTFTIRTGTISLQAMDATYIAGVPFSISSGAVLDLDYPYNINVSGTLAATGGGTVTFTGGTMSGAVQFDTADGTLPAILNFASNTFYDKGGVIDFGNTGLTNTGDIYFQGANNLDRMTNRGTLFIDAGPFNFAQDLTNDTTGVINFTTDTVLTQSGGILTNKGLIIKSGGTGTTAFTSTYMVNQGTIEVASGTLQLPSGATGIFSYNDQSQKQISSGQTLKVDAGASLTLDQPLDVVANSGTVILGGAGATFPALATVTTNNGTLQVLSGASFNTGAGLTNAGTLTVGGDVTVAGDLTEDTTIGTPVLDFMVFANPGAAGVPLLTVTGTTTLAGNLTAELTNGFVLTAAGSYTAAQFSSTPVGSFASTAGVGPAFTVAVNPTDIVLTTSGSVAPVVTTGLSPVITKSTIPAAIVSGVKAKGVITIALTNTADAVDKGQNLISVYATTNGVIDGSSLLVGSVEKKLNLLPGKGVVTTIPIKTLVLPAGSYTLLAQAKNVAGVTVNSTTGPSLAVAAPFVTLSESVTSKLPGSLVSGTKVKGTVTVAITNHGNVASKGITSIMLSASTESGTPGTTIVPISKNLTILPDKTVNVVIPVKTIPALADGNYFAVVQTTGPFAGGITVGSSAGTTAIAAPVISLNLTLGSIVKVASGVLVTVGNSGNVDDLGKLNVTLGFSLDAAGTHPVGTTVLFTSGKLNILSGKNVKTHLNQWKTILSSLVTGVPYYLTATVTDGTGNAAFGVSPNSFSL